MPAEKLYIIIVGCGRLGAFMADRLSRNGHSVVAIDINPKAFDALSAEYGGFKLEGNGTELSVLKKARIDKADLVIAATRHDNANLMVAQIARKIFNVPEVFARIFDPKREEIYQSLGVDTVCPTTIAADALTERIEQRSRKEADK